jgi:hypothetical protein
LRHVRFGLGIGSGGAAQAACPAKTNNLRNIRSPDVVTAERRPHHAGIVRPEANAPSQIHGVRRSLIALRFGNLGMGL